MQNDREALSIDEVVSLEFERLTEEDFIAIKENPHAHMFYFSWGTDIRSSYFCNVPDIIRDGMSYEVIQRVIEKVTGEPRKDWLEEMLEKWDS